MISEPFDHGVEGVAVGHWTAPEARTGCTVILLPPGSVASGEVRGGAPATREFALLEPGRLVDRVDAVVLTGGSAFGLASADGVMGWLAAQERGFPTPSGPVPIVVAMGLFDLAVGDATVRPTAESGREACITATDGPVPLGLVGAGTGATVGKWRGWESARPGGLVGAVRRHGDLVVAALLAVNALGDPDDGAEPGVDPPALEAAGWLGDGRPRGGLTNTTIGIILTNARLDKLACHTVAQGGHDGLARSLLPAHTASDGDALVAVGTGSVPANPQAVRQLATTVVSEAVRTLVVTD